MVRQALVLVLAICLQAGPAPTSQGPDGPAKFRFVLAQEFHGWGCIDFGVAGAPPLKQDGRGIYEIEPAQNVVISTSSLPNLTRPATPSEVLQVVNGQPHQIELRDIHERSEYSTTSPVSRYCFFVGSWEAARATSRPPTLHESAVGAEAITQAFEFVRGSLCDLRDWSRVCMDAKDVEKRNVARTINDARGADSLLATGRCNSFDGVIVRYDADWAVSTHSSERGPRFASGEVSREGSKGTIVSATWADTNGGTADEVAKRFGRDLAALARQAAERCRR